MTNLKAFALAGGIVWGGIMFLTTLLSIYTGYADRFLDIMVSIYPGYHISLIGCFIGAVYGFFDAFVGLLLLGYVYEKLK